jgi:hypothetical protein
MELHHAANSTQKYLDFEFLISGHQGSIDQNFRPENFSDNILDKFPPKNDTY